MVGLITFIQVLRALGLFAFMAAMPLFGVYLAVGGGVVGAWAAGTVAAAPPIAFLLLSIGGANPRRRR